MHSTRWILLLTILFCCHGALGQPISFIVGYENAEQPPYYMGQETVLTARPGIAVEMVQMLAQEIGGLQVQLHRYPWKRCTQYLQDGQLDAIFNASFKMERLSMGRYPWRDGQVDPDKRITTISYALYLPRHSAILWDGTRIHNLGDGRIAAPRGYSIVGDLKQQGYQVEEVNSSRQIMLMLQNGRVAAGAMQLVTADTLLASEPEFAASIQRVDPPLVEKPYYLMISNQFYGQHPELAEQIWSAIERIRNEQLNAIEANYLPKDKSVLRQPTP